MLDSCAAEWKSRYAHTARLEIMSPRKKTATTAKKRSLEKRIVLLISQNAVFSNANVG